MIKTTVKISSSPLVLKEGILANNDILNFEEFKSFIGERLDEQVLKSLNLKLSEIQGCIEKGNIKEAYLKWEKLE